ncbi:MAG TPA: hypothetical protein PLN71_09845, partial [Anaerolineae bacterium]|nr:hypothetical protein [Anaerolineae bacterium]
WLLVAGYWLLVTGCWLLVTRCWLLVAGYSLLVAGCWLLVVDLIRRSDTIIIAAPRATPDPAARPYQGIIASTHRM